MKVLIAVAFALSLGACSFLGGDSGVWQNNFDVKAGQAYVPDGQSGDQDHNGASGGNLSGNR